MADFKKFNISDDAGSVSVNSEYFIKLVNQNHEEARSLEAQQLAEKDKERKERIKKSKKRKLLKERILIGVLTITAVSSIIILSKMPEEKPYIGIDDHRSSIESMYEEYNEDKTSINNDRIELLTAIKSFTAKYGTDANGQLEKFTELYRKLEDDDKFLMNEDTEENISIVEDVGTSYTDSYMNINNKKEHYVESLKELGKDQKNIYNNSKSFVDNYNLGENGADIVSKQRDILYEMKKESEALKNELTQIDPNIEEETFTFH